MWFAVVAVLILLVAVVLLTIICRQISHELKDSAEIVEKLTQANDIFKEVNEDLATAIRAHIQGRDEQEENYEQQFLSFTERIDALIFSNEWMKAQNEGLEEIAEFHAENCLPQLMRMVDGVEKHE